MPRALFVFDSLFLLILTASFRFFPLFYGIFKKIHTNTNKIALFFENCLSEKITCLRLFHSLRLLILGKFYMPTFIQEPMFIGYSRVYSSITEGQTEMKFEIVI